MVDAERDWLVDVWLTREQCDGEVFRHGHRGRRVLGRQTGFADGWPVVSMQRERGDDEKREGERKVQSTTVVGRGVTH